MVRFVVGQEDALADVSEPFERDINHLPPESEALVRWLDEDVLDVDDRHIVTQ